MSSLSAQPPSSLVGLNRTALKQVLADIGVAEKAGVGFMSTAYKTLIK